MKINTLPRKNNRSRSPKSPPIENHIPTITRGVEQLYKELYDLAYTLGVYSWEDLPDASHELCHCSFKPQDGNPYTALALGFAAGRSSRNHTRGDSRRRLLS